MKHIIDNVEQCRDKQCPCAASPEKLCLHRPATLNRNADDPNRPAPILRLRRNHMNAATTRVQLNPTKISLLATIAAMLVMIGACKRKEADPSAGAPPQDNVVTAFTGTEI